LGPENSGFSFLGEGRVSGSRNASHREEDVGVGDRLIVSTGGLIDYWVKFRSELPYRKAVVNVGRGKSRAFTRASRSTGRGEKDRNGHCRDGDGNPTDVPDHVVLSLYLKVRTWITKKRTTAMPHRNI